MIGAVRIFLAAMLGASFLAAPDTTDVAVRRKPDTTDAAIVLPLVRSVRLQADPAVQPDSPQPIERGTLRLHYVQKPIGYERYQIVLDAASDGLTLTSDFDFTDRGGRVQLNASLRTKADFTPLTFKPAARATASSTSTPRCASKATRRW